MSTQTEELPITKMLEAKETNLEAGYKKYNTDDYRQDLNFLAVIIPQVRQLEQEQLSKARKEEREKVTIELNNLWLSEQEKWRKRHIEEERDRIMKDIDSFIMTRES